MGMEATFNQPPDHRSRSTADARRSPGLSHGAKLIRTELPHLSNDHNVFGSIESWEELDANKNVLVRKDFEITGHRSVANSKFSKLGRTHPPSDIFGLSRNRRSDIKQIEGIESVPINRIPQCNLGDETCEDLGVERC